MSGGVLVVGAGLAGQRCAETLRARGFGGRIQLVGEEPFAPYDRPPLSKELLRADTGHGLVALRPDAWYAAQSVELVAGRRAIALDHRARTVALDDGSRLRAAHVVVATGARPRTLPALVGVANAFTLRTLVDARALGAALVPGARLVVAGGGLIGLEVAATARRLGLHVTVVEAAAAPLAHALGPAVGRALAERHRGEGVDMRLTARITAVHGRGRAAAVMLSTGDRVPCDVVLVAVGTVPAAAWADWPDGIVVDAAGRAGPPGVWAAGDVALSRAPDGGALVRAEHWEGATRQGAAVAHAILGLPVPAMPPPAFWSDQFGTRLHVVGTPAGHDAVAVAGDIAGGDARVLYRRRGRTVAGLLIGRPRELPRLRALVAEGLETERAAA